jgi:hypothetical protein
MSESESELESESDLESKSKFKSEIINLKCCFCNNLILEKVSIDLYNVKGSINKLIITDFPICEECSESKIKSWCYLCEDDFQPYESIFIYKDHIQICFNCHRVVEKVDKLF